MVLWIYLMAANIAAFILYRIDKGRAIKGQWRISEAMLLGVAAIGGGVGALLGMAVWHHKTRKWKFRILVPLFVLLWTVGIVYCY